MSTFSVNASNYSVSEGGSVALSAFIGGLSNGDTATWYTIQTGYSVRGHNIGRFYYNGQLVTSPTINVPPGGLANLTFVAGTAAGNQSLVIQAFDPKLNAYSAQTAVTLKVVPAAPAALVHDFSVAPGETVAASSFFSGVSNPAGDQIGYISFRDLGGDGGHFTYQGVDYGANQAVAVDPAHLADLFYTAGAGAHAETLSATVFDATTHSLAGAASFHALVPPAA